MERQARTERTREKKREEETKGMVVIKEMMTPRTKEEQKQVLHTYIHPNLHTQMHA